MNCQVSKKCKATDGYCLCKPGFQPPRCNQSKLCNIFGACLEASQTQQIDNAMLPRLSLNGKWSARKTPKLKCA